MHLSTCRTKGQKLKTIFKTTSNEVFIYVSVFIKATLVMSLQDIHYNFNDPKRHLYFNGQVP